MDLAREREGYLAFRIVTRAAAIRSKRPLRCLAALPLIRLRASKGDKQMKASRHFLFLAALCVLFSASGLLAPRWAAAQSPAEINTLESGGVAIKGYDPVAYFTEGKPVKGSKEFTAMFKGAAWHFSSAENKAKFEAEPEKYAPAYGGYCAYGVASGYLVKIEPDAWAIRDSKLYLNYDRSVQAEWAKSPEKYIEAADKAWPKLLSGK